MSIRHGPLTSWLWTGSSASPNGSIRRPPRILTFDLLEGRVYLSGGGLAGRLTRSPKAVFFHTPQDPAASGDQVTPRLGRLNTPAKPTLFHTPQGPETSGDQVAPRGFTTLPSEMVDETGLLDLGRGRVAFLTDEFAQGRDLNRDGDKLDRVLQVFDSSAGVVRNSGQQAIAGSLIDLGHGLVAFLTDEFAQGRVLNGDSDKLDNVLQVFDAATGVVRNSGQQAVAGSIVELENGGVAFLTSESAQGRVLNGDQDKLDNVLQTFDPETGVVRNSGQQAAAGSLIDLENGIIAFLTDEFAQGRVLNGDGDKADNVLQAFDATSGIVRNSGAQAIAGSLVDLGSRRVAFATSEAAQGSVLNADGDKLDSVLQIFDTVHGTVQNTGQAVF